MAELSAVFYKKIFFQGNKKKLFQRTEKVSSPY